MANGKEKIFEAKDIAVCGFVPQMLYAQLYPNGLTAREMKDEVKKHPWLRRVYDLVVIPYGTV